jgi:cytochrome oxidase assembly protein ShyY1
MEINEVRKEKVIRDGEVTLVNANPAKQTPKQKAARRRNAKIAALARKNDPDASKKQAKSMKKRRKVIVKNEADAAETNEVFSKDEVQKLSEILVKHSAPAELHSALENGHYNIVAQYLKSVMQ